MTWDSVAPVEPDPRASLDVVVPLFNEADGLAGFHAGLTEVLEALSDRYRWGVTYVVDPSPDGTAEIVRRLADADSRVRGVLLLRRAGHQMSLVAGMEWSSADAVITMDGDLQHPPALIPQMLQLFEGGADVVQTVRTRTEGQSRVSRALSGSFYKLIHAISHVRIVEGGADFRLLSARAVRIVTAEIQESDRFLRGLVPWIGLPTETIEFEAAPRAHGSSKYTLARSLQLAGSGVVSFSKAPLHLAIILGLVVSGLGLVSGIAALVMRLAGAAIPAGWATLVVMVAVLSGVQLICLGFIGLYLGVVFDEAKRRPQILVEDYVSQSDHHDASTAGQATDGQTSTALPRDRHPSGVRRPIPAEPDVLRASSLSAGRHR